MFPQEVNEPWSAEATLDTGDATKTVLAGRTNRKLVLTSLTVSIATAAAQAITIAIGTTTILILPASAAGQWTVGPYVRGLVGQSGSGLVATPAAAGPKAHISAEGYYDNS